VEERIIRAKPDTSRRRRSGPNAELAADDRAVPPIALPAAVRQLVVDEAGVGQRLDNFLLRELKGAPKTLVYRIIRSGEVRVNKGRAQADTRLQPGDVVRVPPLRLPVRDDAPAAPAREFPVLYEDDWLIALDKPAGVAVHGGSGVSSGVIEQLRQARPQARFLELVHRLDRETSGVLLVAKKRSALTALQEQFRTRGADKAVSKTYGALVLGDWPESLKQIDQPLQRYLTVEGERRVRAVAADVSDAKRAITRVQVERRLPGFTLLRVRILTGRTHQIRVHLAGAGHPIAGDDKYGDFETNRRLARGEGLPVRLNRMFLHAKVLRFRHPQDDRWLEVEAPWPKACESIAAAPQS
jgi:23S rRNA pseudouridine955/2504/2580 synthase